MTVPARVPVLVVSGFLGAGKTTLVRHLLEEARSTGLRMAVISNELGELGVDRALLGDGEEVYVELEGGCVCCRLSDELVETLQMIRERSQPERIVIETSGAALPFETILQLWRPPIVDWVGDHLSVVVASGDQVDRGRDLEGLFEDQLGSGDMVVLSKMDLVDPERHPGVDSAVAALCPGTPVIHASHGQVPSELLFVPTPDRTARSAPTRPHGSDLFEVTEERFQDAPSMESLRQALVTLDAVRVKGFVRCAEGVVVVQGVGQRLEITETSEIPRPELADRVVVIRWRRP